jgi:trigger factor
MSEAAPESFQNSFVKCTLHKKPGSRIELEVFVSKELSSSSHDRATKSIAKSVSIPGFRKGKAPDSFVTDRFPKEIQKQWQDILVHEALQQCLKIVPQQPLNKDEVSFQVHSLSSDGTSVSFAYEVYPVIPEVDPKLYKAIEVKRPTVDKDTVAETIRQALFFYASWDNAPADKCIEEGDFVMLDIDIMETTPPSSLFKNTRFEVVDKSMAKWMKDALLGKKAGDVVETVSVPEQETDPLEKELKPQKVQITVKAIEIPSLPELSADLLKALGASSEEDLKSKVEALLHKQADEHVLEKQREHVREFLLASYPFDVPASLINNEMRFRVNQLNNNEDFLQHWRSLTQEDQKKTIQMVRSQSEKAVKLFHLCNKIAKDHNLSASPYQIPKPPESAIEMLVNPNAMHHHDQPPELQRAEIMSKLILEKAEDYIIAQSKANVVG